MIYLSIFLILIEEGYFLYQIFKNDKKPKIALIIKIIIDVLIIFSNYYLYRNLFELGFSLIIGLSFLILHKHKVSILFYSLFYTIEILLIYLLIRYNLKFIFIIITFVFFLAENNHLFMKKSYEESVSNYQNKIIQKQVDEMQNLYLTMRGWRHDYHNHLQTLKAHLAMHNLELANQYLNELESDLDSIRQLVNSENMNLNAIINSKLSYATNQNIEINVKVNVPEKLTVTDIDLCVLIGNLIDNAVEACLAMKEGHKFIRLYVGILKQQLYISITNSTGEVVKKLDHEYITTKRGNHGHGLKRIDNIVNKYVGFINRKNEPGVFATEIMLPL